MDGFAAVRHWRKHVTQDPTEGQRTTKSGFPRQGDEAYGSVFRTPIRWSEQGCPCHSITYQARDARPGSRSPRAWWPR
ncbi:hypothetical protein SCOCK_20252 [Actinacidiphila cocklensis]|uniref:Uncharacterized protein n=1 Tax=Actinacidiphila cocklensis TaxID=887465 RepID=A0A9W4DNK5_9ACTN|nr:hypothetical protein SCOCK_20252 [Actinacidiphila cocklensis]